jgi:hypothetical protein
VRTGAYALRVNFVTISPSFADILARKTRAVSHNKKRVEGMRAVDSPPHLQCDCYVIRAGRITVRMPRLGERVVYDKVELIAALIYFNCLLGILPIMHVC